MENAFLDDFRQDNWNSGFQDYLHTAEECLNLAQAGTPMEDKAEKTDSPSCASKKFLGALERLTKTLEVPSLREYGIDLEKFAVSEEKMASDALASGSPANTRKAVIKEDIIAIYDRLRLA